MLFHALPFVFLFLPITLAGFLLLERGGHGGALLLWLLAASLVFYAWGEPTFVLLLAASIAVNYALGRVVAAKREGTARRLAFWCGIAFNVGLIGVFKYADFALGSAAELGGWAHTTLGLALPLGISFFTFQQIAWLADLHGRRHAELPSFRDYALFISFFPQLVAGPIVHWGEIGPQIRTLAGRRRSRDQILRDLAVGLSLFAMGLAKKIVVADGCAAIASPVFGAAEHGGLPAGLAWGGLLAYTLQIYFDFSGYSDMALGLGRLFGLRLPVNFYSPYKQTSIIAFWRAWHITLSRFLRDYLYIPFGGSRHGRPRQYLNLFATMLIGGLWHGAAWTFVIWGGLHGLFLAANHAWRRLWPGGRSPLPGVLGWAVTFLAVMHAWILFRAESFAGAATMLASMYGAAGAAAPLPRIEDLSWSWVGAGLAIAILAPNSMEIFRRYRPGVGLFEIRRRIAEEAPLSLLPPRPGLLAWRPVPRWAAGIALCLAAYLYIATRAEPYVEFIYFRF